LVNGLEQGSAHASKKGRLRQRNKVVDKDIGVLERRPVLWQ